VYFCDLYSVFFLLFVSNSQVIGCEDHLQNDLYCVRWGVKLYSVQSHGKIDCLLIVCCQCSVYGIAMVCN